MTDTTTMMLGDAIRGVVIAHDNLIRAMELYRKASGSRRQQSAMLLLRKCHEDLARAVNCLETANLIISPQEINHGRNKRDSRASRKTK